MSTHTGREVTKLEKSNSKSSVCKSVNKVEIGDNLNKSLEEDFNSEKTLNADMLPGDNLDRVQPAHKSSENDFAKADEGLPLLGL